MQNSKQAYFKWKEAGMPHTPHPLFQELTRINKLLMKPLKESVKETLQESSKKPSVEGKETKMCQKSRLQKMNAVPVKCIFCKFCSKAYSLKALNDSIEDISKHLKSVHRFMGLWSNGISIKSIPNEEPFNQTLSHTFRDRDA